MVETPTGLLRAGSGKAPGPAASRGGEAEPTLAARCRVRVAPAPAKEALAPAQVRGAAGGSRPSRSPRIVAATGTG